ncbi:hypothetical protein A2U01_0055411, partial [Trifolium medium]|nr:hypothetical protein [Trifolium medium]
AGESSGVPKAKKKVPWTTEQTEVVKDALLKDPNVTVATLMQLPLMEGRPKILM